MSGIKYQVSREVKGYKRLIVWREAHKLCLQIYKITAGYPKSELYGLVSQMRRAAVSIVANIIEGQARSGREFLHFLVMSNGSLVELEYYLELSLELGFIDRPTYRKIDSQRETVGKLLGGLIRSKRS